MRNTGKSQPLLAVADAAGVSLEIVELDVTDDDSVRRAIEHVLAAAGQIDVLVNNAGVGHYGTVELMPWEWLQGTFDTNFGVVRMIRAVLPSMRERKSGAIVNVSSANGRMRGLGFAGMYGVSKHRGHHERSARDRSRAVQHQSGGDRARRFRSSIVDNGGVQLDPDSPYGSSKPLSTQPDRPAIPTRRTPVSSRSRSLTRRRPTDPCTCSSVTTPNLGRGRGVVHVRAVGQAGSPDPDVRVADVAVSRTGRRR